MFGSPALEAAIGVIFIFTLMSALASMLVELIAALTRLRANTLRRGIESLLDDSTVQPLSAALYANPLIRGLRRPLGAVTGGKRSLPSYIPSAAFTGALIREVTRGQQGKLDFDQLRAAIDELQNESLREALTSLVDDVQGDLEEARRRVSAWFDSVMDRVSGWYKRRVQLVLLVVAAAMTGVLNVDAFVVTRVLFQDARLRGALVAAAESVAADQARDAALPGAGEAPAAPSATALLRAARTELDGLALPVGWPARPKPDTAGDGEPAPDADDADDADDAGDTAGDPQRLPDSIIGWLLKVLGLVLTAVAASFGAPFWFGVLNRLTNLRTSGPSAAPPGTAAPPAQR